LKMVWSVYTVCRAMTDNPIDISDGLQILLVEEFVNK
jgi:hypothetical protein